MRPVFANSWNRSLSWFFYAQGMRTPPLGMCRAAAFAAERGHDPIVVDGQALLLGPEALADRILDLQPEAVIVGAFPELHLHVFMGVSALPYDLALLHAIRRREPRCRLFLGGYLPEHFEDRVIPLAPEGTTVARDFASVLGEDPATQEDTLATRSTAIDGYRFLEPDIGSYGVDADFFLMDHPRALRPVLPILTAWGCPHRCTFCATPVRFGHRVVQREIHSVVHEIEEGIARHGCRSWSIWDDTFTTSPRRLDAFVSEVLRRGLDFRWWCFGHARWVLKHQDLLEGLRQAGCRMMWIGIEATESGRLEAYSKGCSPEDGPAAIQALVNAGILPTASFILGEPEDDLVAIQQRIHHSSTLEAMGAVIVHTLSIPVPGTDRFRQMALRGDIRQQDIRLYSGVRSVVHVRGMSPEEVEEAFFQAYADSVLSPRWMRAFGRANLWDSREDAGVGASFSPTAIDDLRKAARREFARLQALEQGDEPLVEAGWFVP